MIHKNLTPFYWGPRVTARRPRELEMAVCVRAVFRLAPGQPVEAIEDPIAQGFMSGETFADDDINQEGPCLRGSDFADWKMHGEFLLHGTAHAPGGLATDCTVRARLGDWQKAIRVVGPRAYKKGLLLGGKASEPQPFASMPLTWQNAYGGDGYGDNPVGRGFVGEELPTLERVDDPVRKVGQRGVSPATFLPISANWPGRRDKRGRSYGASWKKTRAPFYSEDFDWTHFQSAPEDQWIDGYWRGDEQLTLENLHPSEASWTTRLPGVRLRAFVKTADGTVHEPTMNLDTVTVDTDAGTLQLSWRGHVPITQLDLSDVAAVLLAQEALASEPQDAQSYVEQLAAFESDPVGLAAALPPGFQMVADAIDAAEQAELNETPMPDLKAVADNLPPECPFPPWFLAAAAGEPDPLGIKDHFPPGVLDGDPLAGQADAIGGFADPENQKQLLDDLAELGTDPGKAADVLKKVASLLPPDQQGALLDSVGAVEQAIAAAKVDAGDDVFLKAAEMAKSSPEVKPAAESYADTIDTTKAQLDEAGELVESSERAAGQVQDAKDTFATAPQSMDDAVAEALKPLDDVELPAMPEIPDVEADLAAQAAKLDRDEARMRKVLGDHPMLGMFEMGRAMIENAPRPGDLAPDLSPLPAALQMVQQQLAAQGVSAAAMAPLAGLLAKVNALVDQVPKPPPAPEGEFVMQDLRARDFSGQDLSGQRFDKSDLAGAKFVGSNLAGCVFDRCNLTGADLTGAVLTDASLRNANLTKAVLADVRAERASFAHADLGEADLSRAVLDDAKLTSCRAIQARLPQAKLRRVHARFSDLSKCDLRDADLGSSDLSFATMNLVKADRADLTDARLDIAKLTKSRLHDAVLRGTRANMAVFTGSAFVGTDLSGCTYERCDFMKATFERARAVDAALLRAQLRDVTATGCDFTRADLTGASTTGTSRLTDCDFRHVTGPRSVWMDADLSRSVFRHASCPDAFFDGAVGDDVDFTAAVLARANLRKVRFVRTSFAFADLGGAVFQDASLDDADFQKSNCYDAKFLGAEAVRCRFEDAFLVAVQLDDPDRQQPGDPTP